MLPGYSDVASGMKATNTGGRVQPFDSHRSGLKPQLCYYQLRARAFAVPPAETSGDFTCRTEIRMPSLPQTGRDLHVRVFAGVWHRAPRAPGPNAHELVL